MALNHHFSLPAMPVCYSTKQLITELLQGQKQATTLFSTDIISQQVPCTKNRHGSLIIHCQERNQPPMVTDIIR